MSLSQYTSLNLIGHLALDLATDNSSSGTLNNLPTKDVSFIRFTSNSQVIVTGFDPDYSNDNNKILIVSYTGTNSLTLKHSASGSNPINRIQCPSATDVVLTSNSSIILIYDSYSQFWRLISGVGGGGTSDHSLLTNLQGGGGGNYYHSNQEINTTSDVQFNTVTINNRSVYGGTTKPNTSSGVVASIGSLYIRNDGTVWTKVGSGNTDWRNLYTGDLTNEPTGFPVDSDGQVDRTSSGISFSNVNRQFSISPTGGNSSYSIVIKGREYVKTTTETVTISNTEGLHYIYFDESATLQSTSSFSLDFILKFVPVSIVYWDTTNSTAILFGDERHGCVMDSHTHARIHAESGSVYVTGMSPDNFTIDGSGNSESHLTFSVTQGQLRDEDILHTLTAKTTSNPIPIFYRDGTNWRSLTPSISGGLYARAIGSSGTPTTIAYNYLDTGTGNYSRVSLSNNYFVCYHLFGTNDVNNPYVLVMGTSQYNTKPSAVTGALNEIGTLSGLPFVEMVLVATVLFNHSSGDTNSLKASLVSIDGANFEDWRFAKTLNPTTAAINTHNNLGGIYGTFPYYHSDQPISTTDSPSFTGLTVSNISYPNSDGTEGQAVVTDGSGNLSFQTFTTSSTSFTSTSNFNLGSPIYFNGSNVALAKADNQATTVQYVIVGKTSGASGTYVYTCSKMGEVSLTTTQWDSIKESGTGGLTAGLTYYLSPSTSGKIVSWIPALKSPVLKAISSTKAFIDMSITTSETGMGDSFIRETFTGNGSTTSYVLTKAPAGIDYTWVHVGGVYQIPNNAYTLTSATINFTGTPASGSIITVQYARAMLLADTNSVNKFTCFTETVSGSAKNTFNLPSIPANVTSAIVFVGGVIQDNSKYSITESILTFFDSIDIGTQVIVYILNSSGVTTSFDSYVTRKEVNVVSSGTTTISSVFVGQVSGGYRLFDILDPRVSATIYLKHNGVGNDPDVRVDSNSGSISIIQNTQGRLNIYIASNLLTIQNLLGRTTQLRIYRET